MIQQPITDPRIEAHLARIAADGVDLFLLEEGTIRAVIVHGTTMAHRAIANHAVGQPFDALLAAAYLTAVLLGSTLKEEERVVVVFETDDLCGGAVAECNFAGHTRGYLRTTPPAAEPHSAPQITVGAGTLTVIRSFESGQKSAHGQIAVEAGPIDAAVESYFRQSEQTASWVRIAVERDPATETIVGVAALLLQALPGYDTDEFAALCTRLENAPPPARWFSEGQTAASYARRFLSAAEPQLVATRGVEFFCGCSRERFGTLLGALPEDERAAILADNDFPLRIHCHNCGTHYQFDRGEFQTLGTEGSRERGEQLSG